MIAVPRVAAMLAVLLTYPAAGGLIFVGAVAASTFVRQLLFPLREIQRATAHGLTLTMALTALVIVAALAIALTVLERADPVQGLAAVQDG